MQLTTLQRFLIGERGDLDNRDWLEHLTVCRLVLDKADRHLRMARHDVISDMHNADGLSYAQLAQILGTSRSAPQQILEARRAHDALHNCTDDRHCHNCRQYPRPTTKG